MLRAFILATRKLLVPRPLPVYTLASDTASCTSTAIYDVRRSNRVTEHPRSILPLVTNNGHLLMGQNTLLLTNVRCASNKKDFQLPNPSVIACNMINMLKCVDLAHLKDAPSTAFWPALVIGKMQVIIPLLELIGGYCNTMTIFQLHLAAVTVVFFGGVKWGLAVSKNPVPQATWDTAKWILIPNAIALLGLQLPYPLGFLTVAGALVSALYLDLKSCAFPPWANATRLFITVTTLAGLLMALIAYLLFHNAENEKNKKEEKKAKKKEQKDEAVQTDDDEDEMPKNGKNGKNK